MIKASSLDHVWLVCHLMFEFAPVACCVELVWCTDVNEHVEC